MRNGNRRLDLPIRYAILSNQPLLSQPSWQRCSNSHFLSVLCFLESGGAARGGHSAGAIAWTPGQRMGHEHLRLRESGPIRALQLVTPPHSLHTLGCLIFCKAAVRCGPQSSAPIAFPSTYSISRVLLSRYFVYTLQAYGEIPSFRFKC
ncbi:hypothetical protein BDZ91DRAFT_748576 [Kalaharituber pfeilii]|nr:hypothetical protein BDZ91DRAFT_748576 [Kalaharituber pfeilii]